MHPKDDMLRSFVDQELSNTQTLQVHEHLSRCPACQSRLAALRERAERVQSRFSTLAPSMTEQPQPTRAAYRRFQRNPRLVNQKENIQTMFTRRPVWAALSLFLVLVLMLSLTPVRAWASDFLGLFRVQNITVISFDPSDVEESRERLSANEAAIEALMEDVTVEHGGEVEEAASAEEAAEKAGFNPRLFAGAEETQLAVKPNSRAEYTIDQPRLQSLIDAVGMDVQIPAETDGQDIVVEMPAAVLATNGCSPVDFEDNLPEGCIGLLQLPSPTVNAPDSLDIQAMGEAMLQFLGLSAEEARQLSQRVDWTSTMILPVPQGEGISYQDVNVDGVTGTLLTEEGEEDVSLLWVKDGMLYLLRGNVSAEEVIQIANTLQ